MEGNNIGKGRGQAPDDKKSGTSLVRFKWSSIRPKGGRSYRFHFILGQRRGRVAFSDKGADDLSSQAVAGQVGNATGPQPDGVGSVEVEGRRGSKGEGGAVYGGASHAGGAIKRGNGHRWRN